MAQGNSDFAPSVLSLGIRRNTTPNFQFGGSCLGGVEIPDITKPSALCPVPPTFFNTQHYKDKNPLSL
jgi:hypothetical protein